MMIGNYYLYLRHKVKIPKTDSPHCAIFIPVDVDIVAFEPEKVGGKCVISYYTEIFCEQRYKNRFFLLQFRRLC